MNYSCFLNIFRNRMLFLADFSSFRYVVFKNNNLKTKLRSLHIKYIILQNINYVNADLN